MIMKLLFSPNRGGERREIKERMEAEEAREEAEVGAVVK